MTLPGDRAQSLFIINFTIPHHFTFFQFYYMVGYYLSLIFILLLKAWSSGPSLFRFAGVRDNWLRHENLMRVTKVN